LIVVNPLLQDVWDDREFFKWDDRMIQVVSREGLYKLKRLAGRQQDQLDIDKLGLGGDDK
jgi:hypothetical protein